MRYKKIKMFLSIFLLLCALFGSMNVLAADDRVGEIVDGSLLTEDSESTGTAYSRTRGAFLNYGSGGLSNPSGRTVSVSGRTVCYSNCDKVRVTLYLQRLVGSSWVTVATLGPKTATNTYTVSASNSYTVKGGYYYRVSGGHVAIDDGSTESVVSVTNGLWIS